MKIDLICIGKLRVRQVDDLVQIYAARIPHYFPFRLTALPDVRLPHPDAARQKEAEGTRFLAETCASDYILLLDERGKEYTSREFAEFLERMQQTVRRLVMLIGGPYGFSDDIYKRADGMMSLSRMTLPHELARLFSVEQLYRAGTILRGEPYHHD